MEDDRRLRVARAYGGLLVIVGFLVLLTAHLLDILTFPASERILLISFAYTLLGIDSLLKVFATAVESIDLSIERDTDE
jgi:hypothetical protein